jgi:hypothetical protein
VDSRAARLQMGIFNWTNASDERKAVGSNALFGGGWFPIRKIRKPGLYLRNNPPSSRRLLLIVEYGVESGKLFAFPGMDDPLQQSMLVSDLPKHWLAYGPIPDLPNSSLQENL